MELQEAIIHTRQVAEGCRADSHDCAYQHDKLGDWLEELQDYHSIGTPDEFRAALRRTAEIERLEQEGLSCKVGDTVFVITNVFKGNDLQTEIENRTIDEISCNRLNKNTMISKQPYELHFYPSELGKTVFLTRQEAAAALDGGGEV